MIGTRLTTPSGLAALETLTTPAAVGRLLGDGEPPDLPRVTTRGDVRGALGGGRLARDATADGYRLAGTPMPGVGRGAGAELVVVIPGWTNDDAGARWTLSRAREGLAAAGYDEPAVGYAWDADRWWPGARRAATLNGPKLARFTREYAAANPGVAIRYVAHSLGARVALSALATLAAEDRTPVDSVSLLGAAVDAGSVARDGRFGAALSAADRVESFRMPTDGVLSLAYPSAEGHAALGAVGIRGEPPANYGERVVSVPDHLAYATPAGCLERVVEGF